MLQLLTISHARMKYDAMYAIMLLHTSRSVFFFFLFATVRYVRHCTRRTAVNACKIAKQQAILRAQFAISVFAHLRHE